MKRLIPYVAVVVLTAPPLDVVRADENQDPSKRVYGEWLIRVKPDQGKAYNQLIEREGLPLFREAGGRMVGWWNTLVGDLYEHVTIWEYDDMAAFEKAIGFLGGNERFARFVAQRDPLLSGEESRFLRLHPAARRPRLPEPAKFVIHEIHRVPLAQRGSYLDFMTTEGIPMLEGHGFRPTGPWLVDVGRWTEITYLFRFESLAERERLIAAFSTHQDAARYGKQIGELVTEVTTRMLLPAPFSPRNAAVDAEIEPTAAFPHVEQLAPGVFAAGFAHRHGSVNCGWTADGDDTLLIDLPRGVPADAFLSLVDRTTGKPPRGIVLTRLDDADVSILEALLIKGMLTNIVTTPAIHRRLTTLSSVIPTNMIESVDTQRSIGAATSKINFIPLDQVVGTGGAAVHLPDAGVLFAGPAVINGPRAVLTGRDTARWISTLHRLESLTPSRVVPGIGSWYGSGLPERQRQYLAELRRQVAYGISMGRPLDAITREVLLPASYYTWMPYDDPVPEDVAHVFGELTIPFAPFNGRPPSGSNETHHALVFIGDRYHEPEHVRQGLKSVFESSGVVPHFAVDVRVLSADNLKRVDLLVILRDGMIWPDGRDKPYKIWMTPEQEQAVVDFVERGGGFLNLHNSMGLYPKDGPFLDLVGGNYTGHGPLERFHVEVVDAHHPITRGVKHFSVADEQHTPVYDRDRVHILLHNRSDDGKVAAAGWVREPGRGRVCHLANGHTRESLTHPMFQLLMRNAVNWCLRRE